MYHYFGIKNMFKSIDLFLLIVMAIKERAMSYSFIFSVLHFQSYYGETKQRSSEINSSFRRFLRYSLR